MLGKDLEKALIIKIEKFLLELGIRIYINYMDNDKHQEPHFNVELNDGKEASIYVANGKILAGKIDIKTHKINF